MSDADCTCPREERFLGRLYGVGMGRGIVRLETAPGCPVHDPSTHEYTPAERKPWDASTGDPLCRICNVDRPRHERARR